LKEITAINKISKLIDEINYQSAYIEIKTENDKYVLEKERPIRVVGFRKE
jgi:hypothetical protein